MASANSTPVGVGGCDNPFSAEEVAAKAVNKRYEGLVTVRTKAIKGKGAWYWAHLEPILIRNPTTNHPKAVKLKCSLCDAVFSASNPSRTATEHLKRGTCPNISSVLLRPNAAANNNNNNVSNSLSPIPLSSLPSPSSQNHRKRPTAAVTVATPATTTALEVHSLAMIESSRYCGGGGELGGASHTGLYSHHNNNHSHGHSHNNHNHNHQLVLSGGKEDLGALAMLESSVKKLKSPKSSSPGPVLSKDQIDSAIELLAEWFYESCGSVSLSSLENPKFIAFLNHVGLPAVSHREFAGHRLDAKFDEAKAESEARIEDAMFFQVASSGWKSKSFFFCGGGGGGGEENLVKFTVNLPNRTSVFHKAVFTGGPVSSKYAEEILWDSVVELCGSGSTDSVQRCVGIVADKYKAKALKNLEIQNHWMVNLSCQLQGFVSLIKDFNREFPLFRIVTENCLKVVNFVNTESQVRNVFQKYKMQELECCAGLLRAPSIKCDTSKNFALVFAMLEDLLSCSRVLRMVVLDDSCKAVFVEDPVARDVARMVQGESFWNELEAIYSLVKMIRGMAQEIEAERPLVGQCLPLWQDLRTKIKEWCAKCSIAQEPVEKIVEHRFRKMYHPAMAAAFILDPLNLIRDTSGKYLPPFKCLSHEQEKDVDKLITRLVSREEAHIALMELMKWRSEGLDPLYAQAVQFKQRDPMTGKMKIANPQSSRLVWETCLSEFKSLGKVAIRLIFLQSTSCGFKCNWSFMKWICVNRHSRVGLDRAQKMIFVAAHAKLERRDLSNEEEKDAELFAHAGVNQDDTLNEVFADAHSS